MTICFNCGERKIWSKIKKSQNMITMIVGLFSILVFEVNPLLGNVVKWSDTL